MVEMKDGAPGISPARFFVCVEVFASPLECDALLHVFAQTGVHGACVRHAFEDLLVFGGVAFVGHFDFHLDYRDASGVGAHGFGDFRFGAGDVQTVEVGVDAHGGEDAGAECRGTEIGGGEGFAFSVVVFRRVGDEFRAAFRVFTCYPESAQVLRFHQCHSLFFLWVNRICLLLL